MPTAAATPESIERSAPRGGMNGVSRLLTNSHPRLALFGFLWGFALLSHQVGYGLVRAAPLDTALTACALIVMLAPGRPLLLCLLGVVHAATVFSRLHFIHHHWFFASLVSAGLAITVVWIWLRPYGEGEGSREQRVFDAFAPAARWSLVALYLASGFHKLNSDFFDVSASCALVLYGGLRARLGWLPDGLEMAPLLMGLTVAVELGLPLLLLISRCRRAGVAVGVVFHIALALAGYPRFSALGLALLTLFLPTVPPVPALFRLAAVIALLPAIVVESFSRDIHFLRATILLSLAMLAVTVVARRAAVPRWPGLLGERLAPAMLVPLIVVWFGAAPYLGLNTDLTFSMYSNVRTEGGRSNHLVVPASLQVFSYQQDLVRVLQSSDPRLASLAAEAVLIPFAELRARLTEGLMRSGAPVSVSYARGADRYEVPSAAEDVALDVPVSVASVKLLRFRAVEVDGPRQCGP